MQTNILIDRLNKIFRSTDLDAILLFNVNSPFIDSNFYYLTDFNSGIFERSFAIAFKDHVIVGTSDLEYENACIGSNDHISVYRINTTSEVDNFLSRNLKDLKVGYNENFLPYIYYQKFKKYAKFNKLFNASKYLYEARNIKDKYEIEKIKKAVDISKKSLDEIQYYFKKGVTEKELAAQFNYLQLKNGADKNSFGTIVAFDKNTALPHHSPDNTKLKDNAVVLLDVGSKWKNYCSDLTRTFFFKPQKRSLKYKKMADIYDTVEKAQVLGLGLIKDGVDGKNVFEEVTKFINTANGGIYKGKFIHSLGHMIGIDVHDAGAAALSYRSVKLQNGMVLSDEPGIYIYGFGGVRIEDDVLIDGGRGVFL
ncbi:prolidase [Candidatus Mancarchaeum acidiphilum]|uniref:Prolidase n=1 Tax=Candidatus Mancarchaeum acidiphilum TaxID=1920749 RepID=A0A218NNG8_9ARCH|nr:Xaa-Pro peptidase family protein [Candidatus Mancarchaeum acidiphilum]ASI14006.1 prolidase [Candidatus Mancarchaeum acidiphilum]